MWIVSVYLIGPAAPQREFSYFSAVERRPGDVVRLPARGKTSYGLVAKCEPAREARQTVRSAGFAIQKITGTGVRMFSREFLHAVFEIAAYTGTSAGAILFALVPAAILNKLDAVPACTQPEKSRALRPRKPEFVLGSRSERLKRYEELAQSAHAESASFLLLAPTIAEAERIAAALPEAVLFHGNVAKKKMLDAWTQIAQARDPLCVVGTPIALSLPVVWGTIAIERVLARGYERASRPHAGVRSMAQHIADSMKAQLILGSPMLPVEDAEDARLPARTNDGSADVRLIDMRPSKEPDRSPGLTGRPRFELFAPAALGRITERLAHGDNVLLMTGRRGLAPHTTCDDCGTPLSCPQCGSGLVLHEERKQTRYSLVEADVRRWFECHFCGFSERVRVLCPVCGSWRLSMHGIGLTLVAREAERHFPLAKVLTADDNADAETAKASKIAAQFEGAHGAILCATESMLAYLTARVRLAVVVSVDSMLYVPEYSAPERALAFLTELRGMTDGELLLQTRVPEHAAVMAIVGADPRAYYDRELQLREKFHYPPYWTLIRFTVAGSPDKQRAQADAIAKALESFDPARFPGRSPRRTISHEHILVRLPRDRWVDPKLLAFIRSLPPSVDVRVNPTSVLLD